MGSKANKVKFGLKSVHWAKATFDEDGNVTYAVPKKIPGAVNLSLDPEGSTETFWADNSAYVTLSQNSGYSGDLEVALITEDFAKDILHEEEDPNGVLAENTEVETEHFALLFEFDGDKHKTRHVLYNCTCSRPSIESATTEDSKEPQTDTLELTATGLVNCYVKAKTGTNTSEAVYNGWYDAVYEPMGAAEEPVDDNGTEEPQG